MTQEEYLEILFNDVGIDTRVKRNAFLSDEVGREVRYLDDLTGTEKHRLIEILKAKKQGHANRLREEVD